MIVELVGWWETRRGRHIGCHAADGRHAGRRCVGRRGVGRHGRGGPGGGRGRTWAGVASMIRVPDEGDELKARRRRPVTATGQNTVTHRKAHVVNETARRRRYKCTS